ncbi:hypothetical protein BYT27DRAFT_7199055 [Phlegmacium glaucopus]|nr:hypothetical protein BYT27DRAFT_7199055 [Phlegmacium glaucopus]
MFGTPVRHHLNPSTRQRLLEEINDVLSSITEFIHGAQLCGSEENDLYCTLPEKVRNLKDGIQSKQQEINQRSQRILDQMLEISQIREKLERGLKQAISTTFPAYDASRSASIDLLLTTIETALIKLSLIRARSERALYNHKLKNETNDSKTVSQALALAFKSLKKEEREMKSETLLLDQQLHEYETLLQLVDGGKSTGGYQQVVNDWTKVKQESDECKKDLRRLGWTGD